MADRKKGIVALWKKDGRDGTFYTGVLDLPFGEFRVALYKNKWKKEDRQPDLHLVLFGDEVDPFYFCVEKSPHRQNFDYNQQGQSEQRDAGQQSGPEAQSDDSFF